MRVSRTVAWLGLFTIVGIGSPAAHAFATPALPSRSHVSFSPRQGPTGTTVTISGSLSASDRQTFGGVDSVTLYITVGRYAGLETSVLARQNIDSAGRIRLSFVVPATADWRANPMSGSNLHLAATPVPTTLEVAWPCRACGLGTFDVLASALPFTGGRSITPLLLLACCLVAVGSLALAIGRGR